MSNDLKQRIGVRVRAFRKASGKTQEHLADLIGRTTETVSNIERGRTLPSLDTLEELGRNLGVPLSEFFDQEASHQSRKRVETEAQLLQLFRSLSDADADIALGQIAALASGRGKGR